MAKKQTTADLNSQPAPLSWGAGVATAPGHRTVQPGGSQTFNATPAPPRKSRGQAQAPVSTGPTIAIRETQPGSGILYTDKNQPANVPVPPSPGHGGQAQAPPPLLAAPGQPSTAGAMPTPVQPPQATPVALTPIVGTPNGSMYRGASGQDMPFITDPVTNATIPLPENMTEAEWNANIDRDATYAADEMLTTVDGPVGDSFRDMQRRREAVMSAPNLSQVQRDGELSRIDAEWAKARYGALRDGRDILHRRRWKARQDQENSEAADAAIVVRRDAEEKERERIGKIAAREVAVPGLVADPSQIESHAQGILSGAGSQPSSGKVAPGDFGFYQRDASGGHFLLLPDVGRVAAGVAPNGTMVAMPRNATEFAALPDGTMYLAVEDGARVPKMKGKPPEPIDRPEVVAAKIEPDIRARAEERTKAADRFNDDRRKHEGDVRKWAAARKAADAKGGDMAVWDDAHPEPEAPEMPRELARAESEWRAANPGKPFDTSVVTDGDRRNAEESYWAKHGIRAADVPVMRGSDTLSRWEREIGDDGVLVARSPVDGTALPIASASVGGRRVIAVTPRTAAEAARAIADGLPVAYDAGAVAIDRGALAGKEDATVARAVKRAFPRLSQQDMAVIADKLQKGEM